MSDRHDLRRQTREIREALSRFEPEQLVDILTHIFRQYVMDGAAAPASSVTLADELQGLSFAQLIERLQLRLDLPELRLLEVSGSRVMCRVEGRLVPLEVPDSRAPEPLPAMRGGAGIQQIQLTVQQTPAAPPAPAPASPGTESREHSGAAPPGVAPVGHSGSVRPDGTARPGAARPVAAAARPTGPAPAAAGPARPAGPAPAAAGPAPAAARPEKPAPPEKPDTGGRFNLLEID